MNDTTASKAQRTTGLFVFRASMKTTAKEVMDTIDTFLGGDAVLRVDIVLKRDKNGKSFKTLFIHFNQWPDTDVARQVEADILTGKHIDIHYDDSGFWRCVENKMPEPRDLRTSSIFIPRVDSNTTEEQVKDVFATAFHGYVDIRSSHITRVTFVPKTDKNNNPYKAAYVHFAEFERTESTTNFFCDAGSGRGANLRYGPYPRDVWKCVINHNTIGGGTVIDKRDHEKTDKKVAVGPYIVVHDIQAPTTAPSTPAQSSTSIVPPPILRRSVASGTHTSRAVIGADGRHSIVPQSLADAFDASESSQRAGISNIPAWMVQQQRGVTFGDVEEGEEGEEHGEEMV